MAVYDKFSDTLEKHPEYVKKLERRRQRLMLRRIMMFGPGPGSSVLEIGSGTGMFAEACRDAGLEYVAVERNRKMAGMMREKGFDIVEADVPPFPDSMKERRFDVVYSSGVLEHMHDGIEAYHFLEAQAGLLSPGGILVIVVPDALKMGMEFWNLDYTHCYPTCERNVRQIVEECDLEVKELVRWRGPFITGITCRLLSAAAFFYNYRLLGAILGPRPFFYSVHQYIKQDMLMFICGGAGE